VSQPRPVRIARSASYGKGEARRPGVAGGWVANRAAERRARRLFGLFLLVLVLIYLAFVGLGELGSSSGLRSAPAAWVVFSALAAGLAAWGWFLTLGRTPRSALVREGEILVRERLGRVRRFPVEWAVAPRVVQQYPASFLGPEPTEVVEVAGSDRVRRTYLVGERFFEDLVGR
jgi:hypothetical protein